MERPAGDHSEQGKPQGKPRPKPGFAPSFLMKASTMKRLEILPVGLQRAVHRQCGVGMVRRLAAGLHSRLDAAAVAAVAAWASALKSTLHAWC